MADRCKCPDCGEVVDARACNSHMRYHHDKPSAGKEDFTVVDTATDDRPVSEAQNADDILQKVEGGEELVGVADNAIVFRNEIIITDPDIKERVADALVDKATGGI